MYLVYFMSWEQKLKKNPDIQAILIKILNDKLYPELFIETSK